MTCTCRLCIRSREWQAIIDTNDLDQIKVLLNTVIGILADTEADLNYHEVNRDGSWPTARKYAEDIIRRCDEREATA